MCGIGGIIGREAITPERLEQMARSLEHRGPDGLGFATFTHRNPIDVHRSRIGGRAAIDVGLVHTRLAILDPTTAADQPFVSQDRTLALVFNGEIYNFLEIRDDLEKLGHRFYTEGDTEVVLRSYQEWGMDCTTRFVGMWALAILDAKRRQLRFSRDRFGIKPLFVRRIPGGIAFASEIKALAHLGRLDPDQAALARFVASGSIESGSEYTFFADVQSIPAAHWLTADLEHPQRPLDAQRYWSLPEDERNIGEAEGAALVRDALTDSVGLHLRSDVPLGSCLSGGIDSSAIVSIASHIHGERRTQEQYAAFGFCSDDPLVSEQRFMEQVARANSIPLVPVMASAEDVDRDLARALAAQDEPCGSASILAQWFVFQRAREDGVKVMLDGQGADETFGGYLSSIQFALQLHARRREWISYVRLRRGIARDFGNDLIPARATLRATLGSAAHRLGIRRSPRSRPRDPVMTDEGSLLSQHSTVARDEPDSLADFLRPQVLERGMPELLRYEDRNSMAHSIEARVPFLDHRLVELIFTLPDALKLRGTTTKAVLRDAMRGIVPDAILDRRDKVGFRATPDWTYAYARRHIVDLDENSTEIERALLRPNPVSTLLDDSRRDVGREFQLWRVINTKVWARGLSV